MSLADYMLESQKKRTISQITAGERLNRLGLL